MSNRYSDPNLLAEQYQTQDHLAVRIRTHDLYTVPALDLPAEGLALLPWRGDELVLDVGCGNGAYMAGVLARTGRYIAADYSLGMLRSLTPPPSQRLNLDAQQLPCRSHSADIILANHMLYHVPDKPQALAEIRRVLKPAGFLLAATNSQTTMSEFRDILLATAARLGADIPLPDYFGRIDFTLENGADFLAPHFGSVTRHIFRNALEFREPEPIVAYQMSMWSGWLGGSGSGVGPGEFAAAMFAYLAERFQETDVLRVHKQTGFFVCQP
ncbi:MAG: class I SAM-dependent methyltransferase [Anaerolineales bacterium]|nr:class I SAM-dependent methyltransferase [Anaerolineales bacterium]